MISSLKQNQTVNLLYVLSVIKKFAWNSENTVTTLCELERNLFSSSSSR